MLIRPPCRLDWLPEMKSDNCNVSPFAHHEVSISACRATREPIVQRRRESSLSTRDVLLGRENDSLKLRDAVTISVPVVINVIFGLPSKFNRKCEMCGNESDSANTYVDLDGNEGALCQACFLKRVRPQSD